MEYEEKADKLWLDVPATDEKVKLRVTCFNGTTAEVSYYFLGLRMTGCGETGEVGVAGVLKDGKRVYNGSGNNALGGKFKVEHLFTSPNGKKLTYTFPDDYTGEVGYDPDDGNPDYHFTVNYK